MNSTAWACSTCLESFTPVSNVSSTPCGHVFHTGKSFSEALILVSTNPQYDKRLFIELQVQYMKIASSEHGVYINCSECQNKNKKQFVYTTCSQHVLSLEFSCTELEIQ